MNKVFQFVMEQINYFFDELILPERTGEPFERVITFRDVFLIALAILIGLLVILGFVKLGKFLSTA